jgi:Holliday junction resolvase RusA-like endonuclease
MNFAWLVKQRAMGLFPHAEALKVVIEYHMPIPKSYSNKKRLNAIGQPHTKRPDLTNLAKFTEDALNHILWKDDAVIADLHVKKIYAEEPKTTISLEKIT